MLHDGPWKQELGVCRDADELRRCIEAILTSAFAANRARVFFFEDDGFRPPGPLMQNPVVQALWREESAIHEAQLVDELTWRRLCPRADHGHVLVGPLVARGQMVGVIAATRAQGAPTFDAGDVHRMNRVALYASSRLSELRPGSHPALKTLTPREAEVAEWVRRGLKNSEVAARLHIAEQTVKQNLKSIFRKLGVRSRTQLSALMI